jgi:hypothetical protein
VVSLQHYLPPFVAGPAEKDLYQQGIGAKLKIAYRALRLKRLDTGLLHLAFIHHLLSN